MQMSDTRQIAVPPAQVYAALLDPEMLKSCVPGAQEVTGSVEDGFTATVVQKVGPVKATFKGEVTISDLVPDTSLKIDGSGKGGAAGFAKGGAEVHLLAKDGGTELSYDVEAKVGGKLAQLGSRIIDGFAKKLLRKRDGSGGQKTKRACPLLRIRSRVRPETRTRACATS